MVILCLTHGDFISKNLIKIALTKSTNFQVRSKFVLYNLREIANFESLYTTRPYELIQEFKDTGFLIKPILQLREIFAVGKKFKLYGDFN